jgi:hypothetical protein
MRKSRTARRSRRGLIATVAAAAFLLTGLGLIGIALASQRTLEQPPMVSPVEVHTPLATAAPLPTASRLQPKEAVEPFVLRRSKPVALDIPAIDVHSVVRYVGRTAEGALETPAPGPRYDDAAWYRHSPTPGSLGPSVLLGHVDSAANGPSVFFRLGELRPGDRVSVTRADDSVATFIVDKVHRYSKDDFPTGLVYGDIDHAGLRIITCGGAFDDSTGHYLDNIVVFASLAGSDRE